MTTINFSAYIEVTDKLEQAVEAYIEENMGGTDWYDVHNEDSREDAARDHIVESAWAFNSWFIENYTSDGVTAEIIEMLQEKCEEVNVVIVQLIEAGAGMDSFVDNAIFTDGHGHFLSGYDGQEHEIEVDGETYYIYAN